MSKLKKLVQSEDYPSCCIVTSFFSEKEGKEYYDHIREKQDKADDILGDYKKNGLKLMNELFETMNREEGKDYEVDNFIMRQAEFLMVEWLNEINPFVQYAAIRN